MTSIRPAIFLCCLIVASTRPALRAQESSSANLECVSYCSAVRPGTVISEVRLRVAPQQLSRPDLATRLRQQNLEVTVYSDGFDRGLYTVVDTLAPRAAFHAPPRPPGAAAAAAPRVPLALSRLVVTGVTTRLDPASGETMRLSQAIPAPSESVVVRIEGVEPGMDYTFRVPGSTETVTCQAAVCPVDRIQTAPRKQPVPPKKGLQ